MKKFAWRWYSCLRSRDNSFSFLLILTYSFWHVVFFSLIFSYGCFLIESGRWIFHKVKFLSCTDYSNSLLFFSFLNAYYQTVDGFYYFFFFFGRERICSFIHNSQLLEVVLKFGNCAENGECSFPLKKHLGAGKQKISKK